MAIRSFDKLLRLALASAVFASLGALSAGCGGSEEPARTPAPAPAVTLSTAERELWRPLPPDRSGIPVLVYHGIGPPSDFSNSSDAEYGVERQAFAKQMTFLHHAGYQTVGLGQFVDFVDGKKVRLPPRPLLLTFDDGRVDSWTGGDGILRELGFNAVMFVDVGRVEREDPEYLTWEELETAQDSGRWELQLHSGEGHQYIRFGAGNEDFGPFYAYREPGESFEEWRERAFGDIEWGQRELEDHIPGVRPLAFALPYGSYGQDGTNDQRIPGELLGWLKGAYDAVFTQDRVPIAVPGAPEPLGRYQVTRATTGGELYEVLTQTHK